MNLNKFIAIIVLFSNLLLPSVVKADTPSFTYIGVEYVANGDFSIGDGSLSANVGLDGFALNASFELGIFFVQASRFELESDDLFDGLDGNVEDSVSSVAAGMTFELPQTQLYGLIRARRDQLQGQYAELTDDVEGTTFGVEAGARVNITDRLEINANIGIPSSDAGTSHGIGAQFFITDHLGLTLDIRSIELQEDDIEAQFDTTSIGLRVTF